ncbi:hypothetical protein A8A54_21975 [Brucella pseudogrignonensis]|nr:hypothetical protein A8A54_21975 [Brucella pseudogrignonensis]
MAPHTSTPYLKAGDGPVARSLAGGKGFEGRKRLQALLNLPSSRRSLLPFRVRQSRWVFVLS